MNESIHLLHVEDFGSFGVGLADARFLSEKCKTQTRASELLEMVKAVRSSSAPVSCKKKKANQTVNVNFTRYHWNSKLKKYSLVKLSNVGGLRKKEYDKTVKLCDIFEDFKDIYYPDVTTKKGYLSVMDICLLLLMSIYR